jgi:ApaG protein
MVSDDYPYAQTTAEISVQVRPIYESEHSEPDGGEWVWSYEIEIRNDGTRQVQLRDRTWVITDALGKRQHVHGPGVVGEQPVLGAGDVFHYSSFCPLGTPSGFMEGFYTFVDDEGAPFDVIVPAFALDMPGAAGRLN